MNVDGEAKVEERRAVLSVLLLFVNYGQAIATNRRSTSFKSTILRVLKKLKLKLNYKLTLTRTSMDP